MEAHGLRELAGCDRWENIMEFEQNKSLLPYNTFGIDAKAAYFSEYSSEEELAEILDEYHRTYAHLPLLHIGGGSNLLFLSDFSGLVLHSRILASIG